MVEMPTIDFKLAALHKHWLFADNVQQFVASKVETPREGKQLMPNNLLEASQTLSSAFRLVVVYALLHVVVEGYQELGINDESVDALLEDTEMVSLLRRF